MGAPSRILLAIDDPLLRQSVAEHFGAVVGMAVDEAADVEATLALAGCQDLIVVDEALGGLQLCRRLRDQGVAVPLLLLATAGSGGCCAVDAVVAKPLRLSTLAARVGDLLARHPDSAGVRMGPWLFDAGRRRLEDATGAAVQLTDKEAAILCRLGHAGGGVVTRDVLLAEVWGYSAAIATHTLETHIYRLRRKIETAPAGAGLLLTESGGYRLAI